MTVSLVYCGDICSLSVYYMHNDVLETFGSKQLGLQLPLAFLVKHCNSIIVYVPNYARFATG